MSTATVPRVELQHFTHGSAAERAAFVETTGRALVDFGFVRVGGHRVTDACIESAYAAARAFFALPEATKRAYIVRGGGGARGYTPFGAESAKDSPLPDLKEFWHTGRELAAEHRFAALYPSNLWPSEVAGFRSAMLGLYDALEEASEVLLQAIALYLGEPEDTLTALSAHGNSVLRALRYPALGSVPVAPGSIRAAAHEDINLITLLITASASGLELLDRNGEWLPVNNLPGEIVADSGDMLQRITNTKLPATTHRVVNPTGDNDERMSMPFFVHPRPDSVLTVLDSCRGPGLPEPEPDITGAAFLDERLRELGLDKL